VTKHTLKRIQSGRPISTSAIIVVLSTLAFTNAVGASEESQARADDRERSRQLNDLLTETRVRLRNIELRIYDLKRERLEVELTEGRIRDEIRALSSEAAARAREERGHRMSTKHDRPEHDRRTEDLHRRKVELKRQLAPLELELENPGGHSADLAVLEDELWACRHDETYQEMNAEEQSASTRDLRRSISVAKIRLGEVRRQLGARIHELRQESRIKLVQSNSAIDVRRDRGQRSLREDRLTPVAIRALTRETSVAEMHEVFARLEWMIDRARLIEDVRRMDAYESAAATSEHNSNIQKLQRERRELTLVKALPYDHVDIKAHVRRLVSVMESRSSDWASIDAIPQRMETLRREVEASVYDAVGWRPEERHRGAGVLSPINGRPS